MATEDFTTYVEVDPLTHVTVIAGKITGDDISCDEDTYVYKDAGAGHFTYYFQHKVDGKCTSAAAQTNQVGAWCVANGVNDYQGLDAGGVPGLLVYWQWSSALSKWAIHLYEFTGNNDDYYITTGGNGVWFYLTITRYEADKLKAQIYSDAGRTTLLDTLYVNITQSETYRYVYGLISRDVNNAARLSDIEVANLDLQESIPWAEPYSTYLPADASTAVYGSDDDRPADAVDMDTEANLAAADIYELSADNDVYHEHSLVGEHEYVGHRFVWAVAEDPDLIDAITITAKGYGYAGTPAEQYGYYLYVRKSDDSWELLDSHTEISKDTLEAEISADLDDYVIGGNLTVEVISPAGMSMWGDAKILSYFARAVVEYHVPVVSSPDDVGHAHALEAAEIVQQHTVTPADLAHAHALEDAVGEVLQGWPVDLAHGHALEAPTVTQAHTVVVDDLAHAHSLEDTTGGILTGSPDDVAQAHALEAATVNVHRVVSPQDLAHGHALDEVPWPIVTYIGPSADVHHAHTMESPTVSQAHVVSPADVTHAHTLTDDALYAYIEVPLYLSIPLAGARRLSWDVEGTVYVVADGALLAESDLGYVDLDAELTVRGVLVAYTEIPSQLPTPRDEVLLTVTGDANMVHHIERQPDGGDWERVASILGDTYRDGPLDDGLWHYRDVDEDDEGDTATSGTKDVTISSVPDPPSGLDYSWDDETLTLTLTWAGSPSDDVASYPVRSSAGAGLLELASAPVQDTAALSYEQVFTTETGLYIFSVRAKDADGNEEPGIEQVLAIMIDTGEVVGQPAEPRLVEATAIDGGKIAVEWLYDPLYEEGGPGVAHEARIYGDAGSGTVSYAAPLDTVAMSNPTAAARYTWESAALVHGQEYLFVVRIATDAHPAGIETQNTDEHAATADATAPATPAISALLV